MPTKRSAIAKGRAFQKRVLKLVKETFDLTDDEIRTPIGCETGPDLVLSKSGQAKVQFTAELKNARRIGIIAAIDQVKKNLYPGTIPVVIFHISRPGDQTNWITVPLDHYLELRKQ